MFQSLNVRKRGKPLHLSLTCNGHITTYCLQRCPPPPQINLLTEVSSHTNAKWAKHLHGQTCHNFNNATISAKFQPMSSKCGAVSGS